MSNRRRRRAKKAAPDLSEVTQQTPPPSEQPQYQQAPPPLNPDDLAIRYAGPDDVKRIHTFLCLVSRPVLLGPIDAVKSWVEIDRICKSNHDFALIAEIRGELVGTLGVVNWSWWYSNAEFMTDRWFFVYPALANQGVGTALLAEAALIAAAVNRTLIINGKPVKKNKNAGGGVYFMAHNLVHRQSDEEPMTGPRH